MPADQQKTLDANRYQFLKQSEEYTICQWDEKLQQWVPCVIAFIDKELDAEMNKSASAD